MKNLFLLLASLLLSTSAANGQHCKEIPDLAHFFQEYRVEGSFLLADLKNDSMICFNSKRTRTPFIPASTFKIPNTLIALETGVLTDENSLIRWDSTHYAIESWNHDQTLRTAFQYSAVWYYQEVARRIGKTRMQKYLDRLKYGNRDISGGIDRFWLDGGLRISSEQQIDFLKRLYTYQLPISRRNIDILKKIMVLEKTDAYILSAKTGLALRADHMIGWLVGFLERDRDVYFFATNIEQHDRSDLFGAARLEITRKIFRYLKLME